MADQTLVQFRVDSELKKEVTEIYQALGMDLPTAFRMFMIRTKIERGLPFSATLPQSKFMLSEAESAFEALRQQSADVPEMTQQEINDLISEIRQNRRT